MSAKIQNIKNQQNEELSRLNDNFRQKRRQLVESNEKSQQRLLTDFKDREKNIRSSNTATINHIRRQGEENIDATKDQQAARLEKQRSSNSQQYQNLRRMGQQQKTGMEDALHQRHDNYKQQVTEAKREKEKVVANEYRRTRDLQEREMARRKEFSQEYNKELEGLHKKTKQAEVVIRENNRAEVQKIAETNRKEMKHLRNEQLQAHAHQTKVGNERLRVQKTNNQGLYEGERDRFNVSLKELKSTKDQEFKREQRISAEEIGNLKQSHQKTLRDEVRVSSQQMDKVRDEYDTEITHVHKKGDKELHAQKTTQKKKSIEVDSYYKSEKNERRQRHDNEVEAATVTHRNKMLENEEIFKKQINNQEQEFQLQFKQNNLKNSEVIEAQRERLIQSLNNNKKEIMSTFGKYSNTKGDPFYRMQNFATNLSDNGGFYTFSAAIPKHEMEHVGVVVKKDRLVINAKRDFKDTINEDGHRRITNNFQSTREEFPLEYPVDEKNALRSYKDGTLTIKIPKLRFGTEKT